jgi:hypothetical protein
MLIITVFVITIHKFIKLVFDYLILYYLRSSVSSLLVFFGRGITTYLDWHLKEFRFWYNHVRTHMNLDGQTPIEVWTGKGIKRQAEFYSEWDGLLQGYWHPPDG